MTTRILAVLAASLLMAQPVGAQSPAAPPPTPGLTEAATARYLELGGRAMEAFFGGEIDTLLTMMTAPLAETLGGGEGISRIMDQVAEVGGMPLDVLERKVIMIGGRPTYWWEAEFSEFTAEPVVFLLGFDEAGKLASFDADPKSNVPQPDPAA